jgi:hypothetical protein
MFEKGQGGRRRGARNKLSHAFVMDLLEEWQAHGKEALKIARIEEPVSFCKMVAGILPKEFELSTETSLSELTDQDLD